MPIFSALAGTEANGDDAGVDPDDVVAAGDLGEAIEADDPDLDDQINSITFDGRAYTITGPLTDDATDVCTAVCGYLADLGAAGARVEVGNSDGPILASGEAGETCEAV